MSKPDERTCDLVRNYEPRDANEHALVAQLTEFYSNRPSNSRLKVIAQRIERSSEEERRVISRAAVNELCPVSKTQLYVGSVLVIVAIGVVILFAVFAFTRRARGARPTRTP